MLNKWDVIGLWFHTPSHSETSNGHTGSIHRVGAVVEGKPACNGWTHWLYLDPAGEWRLLDKLRAQARQLNPR